MKITVHEALARRRRRQATLLSFAGIAVLLVGLYFNFQSDRQLILYAYMALILGSLLSFLGVSLADQWVRPPRAEVALAEAMKGAGPAYALYHWALPADHVLLAPWGLVLFRVFNLDGSVTVRGDKWRDTRSLARKLFSLGRQPVRNPTRILAIEAGQLRTALAARNPALAEVPMQAVGLFTSPRIELTAEAAEPPALRADGLREWLRAEGRRAALPAATRRALESALESIAAEAIGPDRSAEAQARAEAAAQARAVEKAEREAAEKAEARAERRAKRGKGS
jgi:hypothetical protein